MPHLSSDLFNQMSLYDLTYCFSGEDKVSYPEIVRDEIFYGSGLSHLEREGFDLEGEALDNHFIGDELSYNEDEHTVSKNDYFSYFWGENWLFSLKGSSDCSYVGETENSEAPRPDDELQAIWQNFNYNHDNVEMSDSFWNSCYDCFDDVPSRNDELDGYIADEGLSEWLGGISPWFSQNGKDLCANLEADEPSPRPPGYGEAVVATKSGSQES